ncbi:MAG TPA: ECF transporter S component [Candidatus Pacearchaeota archaeon]|nr:ECF transporter S component [Candidatus Parcubacteria bacterium]HNP79243.1 ECF transporter S component [Candidatus Pacearchaeota archaeon]HOC53497.1 ECF transporter S component [Candidatus Pacearchaeota archaeon]HQM24428.1 ECF transporter S component [Candidatus Pacearchaeota archaeon]
MEQVKIVNKVNTLFLTKTFILMSILIFAPLLKNQMITGPIVNFVLFLSVVSLGRNTSLGLCVFPSIISLFTGILNIALAPVIPFIILSNMVLVMSFDYLKNNLYKGIILSALFKFAFLFLTSSMAISMINNSLAKKAAVMFSYPQFFTALAGGALAILVLKIINNNKKNDI